LKVRTKNIILTILLALLAFFSFLMLRIIYRYSSLDTHVAFLQLKQDYIHISQWMIAFWVHVFTSILVLLAGFTQFSKTLLRKYPKLHRTLGYIYVIDILMITGPAGLLMSFYANGGISSRIAFTLLSVLWISSTALAWYYAVKKKFNQHRIFMIRSFALTLSAISLRLWKMFFAGFTDIAPMDRYRIIAWLGWVLNLIIAEYIIYNYYRTKNISRKGGKALSTI
jgi:hypothetical protein